MSTRTLAIALAALAAVIVVSLILMFTVSHPEEQGEAVATDPSQEEQAGGDVGPTAPAPQAGMNQPPQADVEKWNARINEALTSDEITNDEAALQLMEIARNPAAPDEQRLDAFEHGLNLLPDEYYEREIVALMNASPTEEQMETIVFSLHGRKGEAQLDTALSIARIETSPISEEAYDLMQFLVNPVEEIGRNWQQWERAIDEHLAERESVSVNGQ